MIELFQSLKKKEIIVLALKFKEPILRGHQTNKIFIHVLATFFSTLRILQRKESK